MDEDVTVGDWVICTSGISEPQGGPKRGERFRVESIGPDGDCIGIRLERLDWIYGEDVRTGDRANWSTRCFEKASDFDLIAEVNEKIRMNNRQGNEYEEKESWWPEWPDNI
jgi:hypothetical protein